MSTTGKEGYEPIVQGLRLGPNDGEEPNQVEREKDLMNETVPCQRSQMGLKEPPPTGHADTPKKGGT